MVKLVSDRRVNVDGCGSRLSVVAGEAHAVDGRIDDARIMSQHLGDLGCRDVLSLPSECVAEPANTSATNSAHDDIPNKKSCTNRSKKNHLPSESLLSASPVL